VVVRAFSKKEDMRKRVTLHTSAPRSVHRARFKLNLGSLGQAFDQPGKAEFSPANRNGDAHDHDRNMSRTGFQNLEDVLPYLFLIPEYHYFFLKISLFLLDKYSSLVPVQ
jgi:hypothetical protein